LRAFTTGLLLEMQAVCHVVNRVLLLMAMRVLTIGVLIFAPIAAGQTTEISQTAEPLSAREKLEFRMRRMVSPMAQLGVLTGSAINQWRDEPAEWGQGWDGYGTRVASGEGVAVSYNAIVAVSAIALHLDPRYRRMPHATVKTRIWNAISQEFLAYRDSGGRTINVSTLAGSYGAGFIANTWEPADHSKASDAFIRGTLSVASHTGGNVAREFLPDLLHRFHHSRNNQASTGATTQP